MIINRNKKHKEKYKVKLLRALGKVGTVRNPSFV